MHNRKMSAPCEAVLSFATDSTSIPCPQLITPGGPIPTEINGGAWTEMARAYFEIIPELVVVVVYVGYIVDTPL